MTRLCFRGAALVALVALAAAPADVRGERTLKFTVSINGELRLSGDGADNGQAPPEVVWRRLATTPLHPVEGAAPIAADPTSPLRALVRGNILVEVSTAGRAQTTELRLVRSTPTSGWTVAPEDVNQLGRSLGFGEPAAGAADNAASAAAPAEEPATGVPLWVWAGGAIAAALFAVGLMVRMGVNTSPPARLEIPKWDPRMDDLPEAQHAPEEYPNEYPDDPEAQPPQ
ncbi:MAG TPA: hypothetical protein VKD90_23445 [Gemmataceae bacterium]|nr:hypothetical protein [Gemmataceae bacterium]